MVVAGVVEGSVLGKDEVTNENETLHSGGSVRGVEETDQNAALYTR